MSRSNGKRTSSSSTIGKFDFAAPVAKKSKREEVAAQAVEDILDFDDSGFDSSSGSNGESLESLASFRLSLKPIAPGKYYALSLPFMSSIPTPAPNLTDMGTWTDPNGKTWVVLVTDTIRVNDDGSESDVIYKVYDKDKSDAARDEWRAKQQAADTSKVSRFRKRQ